MSTNVYVFQYSFSQGCYGTYLYQELQDRPANLGQLAGMCTVMGFHPTLLNLPSQQVPRAHVPCLAVIRNQPSVIYQIKNKQVLAVVPEYGRVAMDLEEFFVITWIQLLTSHQAGMLSNVS